MDKFQAQLMAFEALFFEKKVNREDIERIETQDIEYESEEWTISYKVFLKDSNVLDSVVEVSDDMEYELDYLVEYSGIKFVLI